MPYQSREDRIAAARAYLKRPLPPMIRKAVTLWQDGRSDEFVRRRLSLGEEALEQLKRRVADGLREAGFVPNSPN